MLGRGQSFSRRAGAVGARRPGGRAGRASRAIARRRQGARWRSRSPASRSTAGCSRVRLPASEPAQRRRLRLHRRARQRRGAGAAARPGRAVRADARGRRHDGCPHGRREAARAPRSARGRWHADGASEAKDKSAVGAARRGRDPARIHVHQLRGPLPLRRGAHEGRDADDEPDDDADLRGRRRRLTARRPRCRSCAIRTPTWCRCSRTCTTATWCASPAWSPRPCAWPRAPAASTGAGHRVGGHDPPAARRGVPARVLQPLHGPDRDHRPLRLARGRVRRTSPTSSTSEPDPRLPAQRADRHGRQPRRAVRRPGRQLQRRRRSAGRDPRVGGLGARGRQRPVRHLPQPGRAELAADGDRDGQRARGRPGDRRHRRTVEHRGAGRERDQRPPRRCGQAEGVPLPRLRGRRDRHRPGDAAQPAVGLANAPAHVQRGAVPGEDAADRQGSRRVEGRRLHLLPAARA